MLIIQHTTYSKYHSYSKAWWWQHHGVGMFPAAGTGRLVRIEGIINAAMYRNILDETVHLWAEQWSQTQSQVINGSIASEQLCECHWVAQPEPRLESDWTSLERPENERCCKEKWVKPPKDVWQEKAVNTCVHVVSQFWGFFCQNLQKMSTDFFYYFFSEYWQKWIEYILE